MTNVDGSVNIDDEEVVLIRCADVSFVGNPEAVNRNRHGSGTRLGQGRFREPLKSLFDASPSLCARTESL